jgi:hypothetical protein
MAGQRLTAIRRWRVVRVGDVVVLRDPRERTRWILKRCVGKEGKLLDLRGDNADQSTDSRQFGLVPVKDVAYVVLGAEKQID